MPKLNQIIAVVNGAKTKAHKLLTTAHRGWHKDRITGISRTYQPLDDDGDMFPPEQKQVQLRVAAELDDVKRQMADFFNLVATQEYANTEASANITVDGKIIVPDVPVSMLLFLDKQLTDLHTFWSNLPTLPTDHVWRFDEGKNCHVTNAVQSVKTQKVPTKLVKFEPTEHQPGQADIINVDKTIGHWTTVHMSGAIPEKDRDDMIARIEKLQIAVKMAREEANNRDVDEKRKFGQMIFDYIGGK